MMGPWGFDFSFSVVQQLQNSLDPSEIAESILLVVFLWESSSISTNNLAGNFPHRSRFQYILIETERHVLVIGIGSVTPYDLCRCSGYHKHCSISVHIPRMRHLSCVDTQQLVQWQQFVVCWPQQCREESQTPFEDTSRDRPGNIIVLNWLIWPSFIWSYFCQGLWGYTSRWYGTSSSS